MLGEWSLGPRTFAAVVDPRRTGDPVVGNSAKTTVLPSWALVQEQARVIVASGDAAVRAAQQATQTTPIVAVVDDIVASGLVSSKAKPGGNVTGVSILATELDGKRIDLLKRMVPSAKRVGVLSDPSSAQAMPQNLVDTARALGIDLVDVDTRSPDDFTLAPWRSGNSSSITIIPYKFSLIEWSSRDQVNPERKETRHGA